LKPREAKAQSKKKTTSELSKPSLISKIGRLVSNELFNI